MSDLNKLFFELIRVAIGNQMCLSLTPSSEEWMQLYELAKKQSLVGICFAGVQRLPKQQQCPPELLYLKWMGMAAKIQQRNEVVNRQCAEVQKILTDAGFCSCILKGQGIAALYGSDLSQLRQSGDIDVWVDADMEKILAYTKGLFGEVPFDYVNVHAPYFHDTEVEVHWRVESFANLLKNNRFQSWLEKAENKSQLKGGSVLLTDGSRIGTPSTEFNAFYILLHCYHHMFESGLGLRQVMDYYFLLRTSYDNDTHRYDNLLRLLKQFGMERFAKGMMWIMQFVFGMKCEYLICDPDEHEGKFLLNEIMQNGNFGHHDERNHKIKNKWVAPFATRIQHNWHLATHYPSEFFWAPIWLVYHYFWKRIIKN